MLIVDIATSKKTRELQRTACGRRRGLTLVLHSQKVLHSRPETGMNVRIAKTNSSSRRNTQRGLPPEQLPTAFVSFQKRCPASKVTNAFFCILRTIEISAG